MKKQVHKKNIQKKKEKTSSKYSWFKEETCFKNNLVCLSMFRHLITIQVIFGSRSIT